MEISPKVAIWVNVVVALLTAITSGGLSLSGIVDPATATKIVTYAAFALVLIDSVMHAFASSAPGPLAPADPPVVVAAEKVVAAQTPSAMIAAKAQAKAAIDAH